MRSRWSLSWRWTLAVACLAVSTAASAQTVPSEYFEGITLEVDIPTQITTGQTVLLKGRAHDASIPAINFAFTPKRLGRRGVLEHRLDVMAGRFEHRIVFDHTQSDSYALEVWFAPVQQAPYASVRFLSIEVEQGEGPFETPGDLHTSITERAVFEPNVVSTTAEFLPPLSIRAGGLVRQVNAFIIDADGVERSYEMLDDGLGPDLAEGDGIYTLAGVPNALWDLEMDDFGSIWMGLQVIHEDGRTQFSAAECGLVAGTQSMPVRIAHDAYRTDHVVNLVDDGSLFGSGAEMLDLQRSARRFYELFEDEYDFLLIRSSHPLVNGLHGFNRAAQNQVQGIGLDVFDSTHVYGSSGQLKNLLFINFRLVGPFVHELAHAWANFLPAFNWEIYGAHWGLSNVSGVLGGSAGFTMQEDGRYRAPGKALTSSWGGRYAPLELYLMGLIPAEQVPPMVTMQDFQIEDFDTAAEEYIVSGRLDTVTIDQIIDSEGPRVPGWETAPTSFRLATVVVSPEPLPAAALTYFDRQSALVGSDEDHDHAFAAATGYRASLDTRLGSPVVTAVVADSPSPQAFLLAQNYPNPFNSGTVIRFVLPARTRVELAVYSVTGQRVARLVGGVRDAGAHAVAWDGRGDSGEKLASGLYLYRLQAGTHIETRSLLLLK